MLSIVKLDKLTRTISPSQLDKEIVIEGNEEIRSLASSFNSMRFAIKEMNVRRSQFIIGLSHDFKTPLALIKGYADLVKKRINSRKKDEIEYLEIISSKVDQLEGMLEDLFDFVSIDSDEKNLLFSKMDFGNWMINFIERSKNDGNLLGRTMSCKIDIPRNTFVMMNEKYIERAFDNIVHNALRYTDEKGIVTIEAESKLGDLHLLFTDNGPGIAEKDIPFIFESFYRGSPSRRTEGIGLGLAVVKSIMELHRWSIRVTSKIGSGTTFVVIIPHKSIAHK